MMQVRPPLAYKKPRQFRLRYSLLFEAMKNCAPMAGKMFEMYFFLLLATVFVSTQEVVKSSDCEQVKITCGCGTVMTRTYVTLEFDTFPQRDGAYKSPNCPELPDFHEACSNISCIFVEEVKVPKFVTSSQYPVKFKIPRRDFKSSGGNRTARQVETCQPEPLHYATLNCEKWPRSISCEVECTYGHAHMGPEGSKLKYKTKCRDLYNKWEPELEDCQPFLNCEVQLVSAGKSLCNWPENPPAYCEISCVDYDIGEETPTQVFECYDESFEGKLPGCVELKKNIEILPKPKDAVVPIPF